MGPAGVPTPFGAGWHEPWIAGLNDTMLCIPTYVGPSRIHGRGLFAAAPVRRGALVWRFDPERDRILTRAQLDAEVEARGETVLFHVYLQDPGSWVLCGDDAVYMNHDEAPNCDDPDPERTTARRDIAIGEELTVDYRLFDQSASTWLPTAAMTS